MEGLVSGHKSPSDTKKRYRAILEKRHSYNLVVSKLSPETEEAILLSLSMKKSIPVSHTHTYYTLLHTHGHAYTRTHKGTTL